MIIDLCLWLGGPSYDLRMDGCDTLERRGLLLWICDPCMNGNGLNTIELDIDVVLGLFWTKTTTRWVMAMDLMVDLDLDCIMDWTCALDLLWT